MGEKASSQQKASIGITKYSSLEEDEDEGEQSRTQYKVPESNPQDDMQSMDGQRLAMRQETLCSGSMMMIIIMMMVVVRSSVMSGRKVMMMLL